MKLSMWIFADWLKDYTPEIHIRDGKLEIETVRLFAADTPTEDNTLYIGRINDLFLHGNNNIICTHKNDILILSTNDLDEVMNQVLNAFEYYQRWNVRTLEAISADRRPAEILAIANEVIHEPLYMLDANQFSIALSEGYGYGSVNHLWDQMLDHGTSDFSFLTRLEEEYPEHRTNRGLYYFSAPFITERSYNYNMFLEGNWIGLCSMIERSQDESDSPVTVAETALLPALDSIPQTSQIPPSTRDLFHIFCQNLELWYISHSQELRSMMIDSLLRDALVKDGAPDEQFVRQAQLRFRDISGSQYLLVLDSADDHTLLMGHVCRELNLALPEAAAIIYEGRICVLLQMSAEKKTNASSFRTRLSALLKRNGFYAGCSNPFTDLTDMRKHFSEATYVTEHMQVKAGEVSFFSDFALTYTLQEIKNNMPLNLIHPAAATLLAYDNAHHTAFTETLYVYLKKERSQSKTAAALNLHRNTLTYRLQRIRELLSVDLDDDDLRLHLMLSLRFLSSNPLDS